MPGSRRGQALLHDRVQGALTRKGIRHEDLGLRVGLKEARGHRSEALVYLDGQEAHTCMGKVYGKKATAGADLKHEVTICYLGVPGDRTGSILIQK